VLEDGKPQKVTMAFVLSNPRNWRVRWRGQRANHAAECDGPIVRRTACRPGAPVIVLLDALNTPVQGPIPGAAGKCLKYLDKQLQPGQQIAGLQPWHESLKMLQGLHG